MRLNIFTVFLSVGVIYAPNSSNYFGSVLRGEGGVGERKNRKKKQKTHKGSGRGGKGRQ